MEVLFCIEKNNNDYFLLLLVNSIEGAESADVKNQPQRKDGGIICTEKIMIILICYY